MPVCLFPLHRRFTFVLPKGEQLLVYHTYLYMLMQWAEAAQTLQVRVLRLVPKAAVKNECGLPMCAMAGLEPQTYA